MIGIYKITSPNNRIYIGQSINIKRRFTEHKKCAKRQYKLYNSFQKYGIENHVFEVIEECDVLELNERERHWQDFYNVLEFGLNCVLTKSNDKSGFFSKETREKMSISNKKRIRTYKELYVLKTNMKGKKHSKETKLKMSISGKNKSEETLLKMSIASKNIPKESRIKAGQSQIGNKHALGYKHTKESIGKISIANKNKIVSKETCNKISKSKIGKPSNNLGKKFNEDIRLKMSLSKQRIIINKESGIFYFGINSISFAFNINKSTLTAKLSGRIKNNTPFIYV